MQRPQSGTSNHFRGDRHHWLDYSWLMQILIPFCDNFECDRKGIRPEIWTTRNRMSWPIPLPRLFFLKKLIVRLFFLQPSQMGFFDSLLKVFNFSLTLPERERALLLCLFALFLIALLCQVLLSLVSGEVSVISESVLPWRMVAYSLQAYPSSTSHSKKRERAIAFNNPSLIRRGFLSSKAPLRVEISLASACRV